MVVLLQNSAYPVFFNEADYLQEEIKLKIFVHFRSKSMCINFIFIE
jgi:hypothetical protein